MQRATTVLLLALVASIAIATTALAQFIPGGEDETSEINAPLWATGPPSPGIGPAPGISGHLILTELVVTPSAAEFIEIHNPTSVAIALDNCYGTTSRQGTHARFWGGVVDSNLEGRDDG